MILVGNQRGGAQDLALHLMKDENERVQLHELRGFVAGDLIGAFQESYAVSRGTRCKQHLYSLSLSPPNDTKPDNTVFLDAVNRAEKRLGLEGQPRAIVFHEKKGLDGEVRRHAHAVWCRIDADVMKAKQISHDRRKLNDLARDLYIEHDWQMPRGFVSSQERDPATYTLAEWQQAKRAEKDPKALKLMFQECWAISDSKVAFDHALKEKGYILAQGDRRGFVAVDYKGEVYSLSRWTGQKTKALKARLGTFDDLPTVKQAHAQAARRVAERLKKLEAQERAQQEADAAKAKAERERLEQRVSARDAALKAAQSHRRKQEEQARQSRIRTGLRGLLDRMTGQRRKVEEQNRQEAAQSRKRDYSEREAQQQKAIHAQTEAARRAAFKEQRRKADIEELQQNRRILSDAYDEASTQDRATRRDRFKKERQRNRSMRRRSRMHNAPEP